MYPAVGGYDVRLVGRIVVAFEVGHFTPGLFYHEESGGAVPGLELVLIKPVKTAGGYPAEVDGGGAEAAYGDTLADETGKDFQGPIGFIDIGIRETGHQAGFHQVGLVADLDGLAIEGGSLAPFGKIEFFQEGVVHGAHDHFAGLLQANGDAAEGNAMRIVDRAIDGVDDPFVFAVHDDLPYLLAHDKVIGKSLLDDLENGFFGGMVGFGHQVVNSFFITDLQVLIIEIVLYYVRTCLGCVDERFF